MQLNPHQSTKLIYCTMWLLRYVDDDDDDEWICRARRK